MRDERGLSRWFDLRLAMLWRMDRARRVLVKAFWRWIYWNGAPYGAPFEPLVNQRSTSSLS